MSEEEPIRQGDASGEEPRRETEVEEQMIRLARETDATHIFFKELESRLQPVLRPDDGKQGGEESPQLVPHADRLAGQTRQISAIKEGLESILQRLEL